AIGAGRKYIKENKVDAIITTGPPHSAHLVGIELQKEFKLPWIADFRDPWTTVYYNAFFNRGKRAEAKDKALEDKVLRSADHTVVISHGMQEEFMDRTKASSVIPNGYDEADMYRGPAEQNTHFRLCYIGNMKPNQHVPALWEAAAELIKSNADFARDFRFHFTGILDPSITNAFEILGISDAITTQGFVAHKEATKQMFQAGMLLFVIPDSVDNHKIVTGKVFEYIASGTSIFAVGPVKGNASKILEQANAPRMIDYAEKEEMKIRLINAYQVWLDGDKFPLKAENANYLRFSRNALTGDLAAILDKLASLVSN
ncbi:MAG: hypothetical protein ACI959_001702, partial [Limisphaerales bacterium]